MLKLLFLNAEELSEAIYLISDDLGIISVTGGEDFSVTIKKTENTALRVSIEGKDIGIEYGGGSSVFLRGLARAVRWAREGAESRSITEKPIFDLIGAMIDMSRNAVMNLTAAKFMMRKTALMGLNAFMLYTEDTYEVEGYPYFGYMRGRYTKAELKELDKYALALGIELIPCIQTLGHLHTHLKWAAAARYKDSDGNLYPGKDDTYRLIDAMLDTVTECFTTKRIHIGMDETNQLGRGNRLTLEGYRPESELYMEHLGRVTEMVKARGLRPMMWSDMMMHFVAVGDTAGKHGYDITNEHSDAMKKYIPEGVEQVFWDYYNPDENFYRKNVENHRKYLGDCTLFAGGVWAWSGYSILFKRSLAFTLPALNVCKEQDVKQVIATVWHNGAESNLITSLAGIAWYADYGYKGAYSEEGVKECFAAATGESYDSFIKLEEIDEPHGQTVPLSRALLYNDPLIPFADKTIEGIELKNYYEALTATLTKIEVSEFYKPAFATSVALSSLFENKADFGQRLKSAYDAKDAELLGALALECDAIAEKIELLRTTHRGAWMLYNKPFGWEVFDIRYGGLIMRFKTCKDRILSYLSGEVASLEELDAERLRIDGSDDPSTLFGEHMLWRQYPYYITGGVI